MSEEIYIFFKPTEYKYYFEYIRIHCENDKIQIPIHAFPVINQDQNIFPKLIDFGNLKIGETSCMIFPI